MFISPWYFIQNTRRYTERIWYFNTDDTEAGFSSEIQEKRNGGKKQFLTKTCKCYKASKFVSKNDLAKSLF